MRNMSRGEAMAFLAEGTRTTTAIAARYVPPGRAEEYGRVYAEDRELLCRLCAEHLTGARDVLA
jgi:hypothetical protein